MVDWQVSGVALLPVKTVRKGGGATSAPLVPPPPLPETSVGSGHVRVYPKLDQQNISLLCPFLAELDTSLEVSQVT